VAAAVAIVATAGALAPGIVPGLASTAFFTSAVVETLAAAAPTIIGTSIVIAGSSAAVANNLPASPSSVPSPLPRVVPGDSTPTDRPSSVPRLPGPDGPMHDLPTQSPPDVWPDPGKYSPGPNDLMPEQNGPLYNPLDAPEVPRPSQEDDPRSERDKKKDREKKPKKSSPGDKRFIDRLAKKLGLDKGLRRVLHDQITGKNYSEAEIRAIAELIKYGGY